MCTRLIAVLFLMFLSNSIFADGVRLRNGDYTLYCGRCVQVVVLAGTPLTGGQGTLVKGDILVKLELSSSANPTTGHFKLGNISDSVGPSSFSTAMAAFVSGSYLYLVYPTSGANLNITPSEVIINEKIASASGDLAEF